MQQRRPVGCGPSGMTWPSCAPRQTQWKLPALLGKVVEQVRSVRCSRVTRRLRSVRCARHSLSDCTTFSAHGADWIPKCGKRASGCIFGLECRHVSANLRSQGFCDVIVSLVRTHSQPSFLPLSAITSVFAAAGQSATPAFGCKSHRPSRIGNCRKGAGYADRTQERTRDRREYQPGWICRAAGPAAVTSNGGFAGCGCQSCLPNPAIVGAHRGRDHS